MNVLQVQFGSLALTYVINALLTSILPLQVLPPVLHAQLEVPLLWEAQAVLVLLVPSGILL